MNYTGRDQTQFQFTLPRNVTGDEGLRYEYDRAERWTLWRSSRPAALPCRSRGRFGDGVDDANSRKAHGVIQVVPLVDTGRRPV